MHADQVVPVSGRLILLSGLGSILGPLLGMSFVEHPGIDGVLYLIAAASLLPASIAAAKSLTSTPPPHMERPLEILAPQAAIITQDQLVTRDQ